MSKVIHRDVLDQYIKLSELIANGRATKLEHEKCMRLEAMMYKTTKSIRSIAEQVEAHRSSLTPQKADYASVE